MRCGRCGNENAEGNRFCGMCGAPLNAKTQPVGPIRQAPAAPAKQGTPASSTVPRPGPMTQAALSSSLPAFGERTTGLASAPPEPRPQNKFDEDASTEPTISGPSFLGLNQPGPRRTISRGETRGDGGHLQTSGNLDYLLEDEEEEPKRGWGKLVFVLLALALAGGFGYLRWKQGGFDWLTAGSSKAAATQPAADATQKTSENAVPPETNVPAGAVSNPGVADGAPSGNRASSSTAAGTAGTAGPASGNTSGSAAASGAESASGAASPAPVPPPPVPTGSASPNSPQSTSPSLGSPQNPVQGNAAPNSASSGQGSGSQTNSGEAITPPGTASPAPDAAQSSEQEQQPAAVTASRKAASKPATPKPLPARPVDSVTEAQRYIYGRGVPQDCDRGLHMLKSAADRSDAKAMISLGALYSTGATCTPRDLPTAYRYFAMGLHKQPDNQALQDDLQKLWSQMTQPERQLAIKLSQ